MSAQYREGQKVEYHPIGGMIFIPSLPPPPSPLFFFRGVRFMKAREELIGGLEVHRSDRDIHQYGNHHESLDGT